MALEIAQVNYTGQGVLVSLDTVVSSPSTPATMTLSGLNTSDPMQGTTERIYLYLTSIDQAPWYILCPSAPSVTLTAKPEDIWVSVLGTDDVLQIIAVR